MLRFCIFIKWPPCHVLPRRCKICTILLTETSKFMYQFIKRLQLLGFCPQTPWLSGIYRAHAQWHLWQDNSNMMKISVVFCFRISEKWADWWFHWTSKSQKGFYVFFLAYYLTARRSDGSTAFRIFLLTWWRMNNCTYFDEILHEHVPQLPQELYWISRSKVKVT